MEKKIANYLINYLFKRFDGEIKIYFEGNTSTIVLDDKKIVIPEIDRKVKPIEIEQFDLKIPYYRYTEAVSTKMSGEGIYLTYDLIGEIFDHLTLLYEKEGIITSASPLIFFPVLDIKIYYFYLQIKEYVSLTYKSFKTKEFLVGVSHDIDRTGDSFKYRIITYFFQTLKQKRPSLFFKGVFGKNEETNFDYIIKKEKEYDCNSTWFVLTRYGLKLNADYHLKDKEYEKGIKLLLNNHKEIGVHIPYMDLTVNEIKEEFLKLKELKPKGMRMHHLRGEYEELMKLLNDSNILYDSTFGLNQCIAYRFGTAIPFHPIVEGEILENIYEIPMNIMDLQITDSNIYENQLDKLFTILKEVHGVCILNWHNNRFNKTKYGSIWIDTFGISLTQAKKHDGLLTNIASILEFTN